MSFAEALQKHAGKTLRPADLSSEEWARLPAAFSDRSTFSSHTANAWYVQQIHTTITDILDPKTVIRDGRPVTEGLDLASARLRLKDGLRTISYSPKPEEAGTIKDLSSDARLNLILRQNTASAQGYGWHAQGQDPDLLDQWPAQELFRAEERKEPRDWTVRWNGARGKLGNSTSALDARVRMVALKNDPIWVELSAFGVPWPPFDFNSGMDVRDIDREEAEQLGLIRPDQQVEPQTGDFNAGLESSAEGLDPVFLDRIKSTFGDEIQIGGGVIRWVKPGAVSLPARGQSLPKAEPAVVPGPKQKPTRTRSKRPLPPAESSSSGEIPVTPPTTSSKPALSPVETTLLREESRIAKRKGSEKLIVVDINGKVVISRVGGKSSVGFSRADYPLMKDAVITHNHPRGTSFSSDDIRAAVNVDCAEIRAVGVKQPFTYSLKRPASGWPPTAAQDYRDISETVRLEFIAKVRSKEMTVEQATDGWTHEVMVRLAAKHRLQYERTQRT